MRVQIGAFRDDIGSPSEHVAYLDDSYWLTAEC